MRMNKEQNMALVNLAVEHRELFIHFMIGWMSRDHHEEMATAARHDLSYTEEGKKLLENFEQELDKTLETGV